MLSFQSDSDCLFGITHGEEGKVDSCGAEGSWEDYAGCFVVDRNGIVHDSRKAITAKLSGSEKKKLKKHRDYLRGLENRREEYAEFVWELTVQTRRGKSSDEQQACEGVGSTGPTDSRVEVKDRRGGQQAKEMGCL